MECTSPIEFAHLYLVLVKPIISYNHIRVECRCTLVLIRHVQVLKTVEIQNRYKSVFCKDQLLTCNQVIGIFWFIDFFQADLLKRHKKLCPFLCSERSAKHDLRTKQAPQLSQWIKILYERAFFFLINRIYEMFFFNSIFCEKVPSKTLMPQFVSTI